jgi:uncharacterized repeat protein (TIGR03837 family)
MSHSTNIPDCDIFCKVVDNFGDIGVCWRLARQITLEHGLSVRLWVDNLAAFRNLAPTIDPERPSQQLGKIEVRQWPATFPETEPAHLVIQTFACDLPPGYLGAMARQNPPPTWINLEYLSSEDWVEGCHQLPSPHPQLPLCCRFFFPGFTEQTGGLLRETGLLDSLREFRADAEAQSGFWEMAAGTQPAPEALRISLFSYENPALPSLLEAWASGERPVFCAVTEGRSAAQVRAWAGDTQQRGRLTLAYLPFLPQEDYDRLLTACDLNFVRGEDSFVRAQWATRPLVWHIYRQAENAHRIKLAAFLAKYLTGLPPETATALRDFWLVWDEETGVEAPIADAWSRLLGHLPALQAHAERWTGVLAQQEDLCAKLLICGQNLIQS